MCLSSSYIYIYIMNCKNHLDSNIINKLIFVFVNFNSIKSFSLYSYKLKGNKIAYFYRKIISLYNFQINETTVKNNNIKIIIYLIFN